MKTLVIIPCGKAKIWDVFPHSPPTVARLAYTGIPFNLNKRYAVVFGDSWMILSAKYGYISPDFLIPDNYNVSFKNISTGPIYVDDLVEQIKRQGLLSYDRIVGLGGKEYRKMMELSFGKFNRIVEFPFAGLPIGKTLGAIKKQLDEKRRLW